MTFEEVESAAKARPVLDRMLADARAGRLRAIIVWALDRLHRSMIGAIQAVLECDRLGVPVINVREPWLDTSGPVRPLRSATQPKIATRQEHARLIERMKAGIERARHQGKPLGRPLVSVVLLSAAANLAEAGLSVSAAARRKGVKRSTLRRFMTSRGDVSGLQQGRHLGPPNVSDLTPSLPRVARRWSPLSAVCCLSLRSP